MIKTITQCQAGSKEAFASLFEQYKNLVYRTAVLMLGDADEADDALQEVFLQVYRSIRAYCPEKAAFTTWLYRITVNHCLNRKRSRHLNLVPLENAANLPVSREIRAVEERSDDDDVWQAVQKLSSKLRTVIVLRFYLDLSYAEIAGVLDLPLGTVQSRLNQAVKDIRKELGAASSICSQENGLPEETNR